MGCALLALKVHGGAAACMLQFGTQVQEGVGACMPLPWELQERLYLDCQISCMACWQASVLLVRFGRVQHRKAPMLSAWDAAGLNFSSSELSLPLSISGAALMVWSLFCFPAVQGRLGARMCAVVGLAATGEPTCYAFFLGL